MSKRSDAKPGASRHALTEGEFGATAGAFPMAGAQRRFLL
jgi:hypothetical protein